MREELHKKCSVDSKKRFFSERGNPREFSSNGTGLTEQDLQRIKNRTYGAVLVNIGVQSFASRSFVPCSKQALLVWKKTLSWKRKAYERKGGAHRNSKRSGGQNAYYVLKTVLKKVHKRKMLGEL